MIDKLLSIKHWHLSQDFYEQVAPYVIKLINDGKPLDALIKGPAERALSGDLLQAENGYSFKSVFNTAGEGVAIIPLYGTMTKWGGLCSYGTVELANMIKEANNAKDIQAIIIDTDTPGGSSDSIEVMERAIDASTKPIVGYVNDMAASAGLWTMSAVAKKGKVMIDSLQNSSMGSIGTLMIYQNMAAMLRDQGLETKIIRAPQSVDKAKPNSIEPLTQELEDEIKQELKALTDVFINAVKSNYGPGLQVDTPRLFTGGMFNGKQALEIGLAHEQGDFNAAFNLAVDMASTQKKQTYFNTNMNMLKKLGISWSIAQKLSAEELENLAAADEKLGALEGENAQLKEQNGTLETQVSELNGSISAKDETIKQKDAKIEELNAKLEETPAAPATTAVAQEESQAGEGEATTNKYETSADKELAEIKNKLKIS